MRKEKRDGFVLVIIIVAIALIGMEMFVLAGGSNAILFQANNAYLKACEQNLIASGLSWAKRNLKSENVESFNKTIELNLADINIDRATLSVMMEKPKNKQAEVQINASCSRGRQILRHSDKYRIRL